MSNTEKKGWLGDALRYSRGVWIGLLALVAVGTLWNTPGRSGEAAVVLPAPALDNPKASGSLQTAVIAGGCFWGVQGVYQYTRGVKQVLSGYSGGDKSTADYEKVGTGRTGHAESVQIVFDPREISYGEILRIYFSVAHDPTELDRQGPDVGTQYRSAIFYADAQQKRIADAYIAQLDKARAFRRPIVTRVDPLKGFYPAEAYHQDFLVKNPSYPYIVINDLPKIANLKRLFPEQYRDKPVLASAS
ncbi:MAG TPA: peptide-methionine (S)-S-oxide reductase MsrA [Burkholderiales bacterium]|nr:peptide-methionine (S)-S-oxide reductase MsrA [Burkholderiales bacterium]